MMPPKNNWYVAARSEELERTPLARKILGLDLVLFRTKAGLLSALKDRCPHKGVSLSLGKIEGETIRCRYHGWTFAPTGDLKEIPCDSPGKPLPSCKANSYPIVEQDGWIWVYPDLETTPASAPPSYPKLKGHTWWEYVNINKAQTELILENAFDCSHTGFVHTGLFRSNPTNYVDVTLEETSQGMKATTHNEKKGESFDPRSIAGQNENISHSDEFIAPHTVFVDYWFGKKRFITVLICTPEDENTTRTYIRIGMRVPFFNWIIKPFMYFWIKTVIAQDKVILENQSAQLKKEKVPFRLVTADAPAAWMMQAYKNACEGKPVGGTKKIEIKYKL